MRGLPESGPPHPGIGYGGIQSRSNPPVEGGVSSTNRLGKKPLGGEEGSQAGEPGLVQDP